MSDAYHAHASSVCMQNRSYEELFSSKAWPLANLSILVPTARISPRD